MATIGWRGAFERLEPRMLLTAGAMLAGDDPWPTSPYIELGPSDNIALDQPRVAVELFEDPAGTASLGPRAFNTFLLDTGANSILTTAQAVRELVAPPHSYVTEGEFIEFGVAGEHPLDISASYRFDFAGTDGQRLTLNDTRILSDAENDFSFLGPWGIVGMPAMVNRVTTLDFTGWSGGGGLENLYMEVDFADVVPADGGHRYSVSVDNRTRFDPAEQVVSGEPPIWADIPFLTAVLVHQGRPQSGDFVFDTGAQLSVISTGLGMGLGLDTDGDGELTELDDGFAGYETVSGLGGQITAPTFAVDKIHVPTQQGVDLVWTDLRLLVLDIADGIDGVFGSDLLVSGWFEAFFLGGDDGYVETVHFDFHDMDVQPRATGTIHFDLNPDHDLVTSVVTGRHVFYNNSALDGNDSAADARDDGAIAPDKEALLPGQTAGFANYTSYRRGINGIMVDIAGLPPGGTIEAADFRFRVGNDNDPGGWADGPVPESITVRRGDGQGGADRVTILWDDHSVEKTWLEVTVLATDRTRLAEPDVFYFGNAVGETGISSADARVNAFDLLGARDNQRNFLDPAPIDFDFDFNRDARVDAVDMLIARNHQTHFLNDLELITVPADSGMAAALDRPAAHDAALQEVSDPVRKGREVSSGKAAWVYEFEPTGANRESGEKDKADGWEVVGQGLP